MTKKTEQLDPGARVKAWRDDNGKTQQELAVAAGLSTDTVSDFERGLNLPSRRTVAFLAKATGIAPELLRGAQ